MQILTLLTLLSGALAAPSHLHKKAAPVGKHFQQWGFIMLENTNYATALANPTFKSLTTAHNNRLLSNYDAISHPSLPNYLATIAGSTLGVTDDGSVASHSFPNKNILDLLEAGGLTWKFYVENYPGGCNLEATNGVAHQYASKHNPPLYFTDITSNPARCANVVPATQFATDMNAGKLPNYWYYVPNLNNDGHDTSVSFVASYLQSTWIPRFDNATFTKNLAMVMTFDENEGTSPNQVYAVLMGGALSTQGHTDSTAYSHYSLLSTVEDNWSLGNLGTGDVTANIIKI